MKTEINTNVTINGVEYEPVGSRPALTGSRAIVVVDRGWIFAGDVTRENGRIRLSKALHVFKWKTGGFSLVVSDPVKAEADLLPIADVDIPEKAEIFCVPVPDNWGF